MRRPKLGLTEVPVIVACGWSEEEKRAYRVADNALAARADWHPEQLFNELQALKFGGFDLDLLGFKTEQLATILASLRPRGLADPDSVPELAGQMVTRSVTYGCWETTGPAAAIAPEQWMSQRYWQNRSLT